MKKILSFCVVICFVFADAQLTAIKDVAAAGLTPQDMNQFIWQNNKWNGKFYYPVSATPSLKLAVTDGTEAGTKIVKDFAFTGVVSAAVQKIIPVQDFFYIHVNVLVSYNPYTYRDELWKSDGTSEGTVLVKRFDNRGMISTPIEIGSASKDYQNNTVLGNEMYFTGYSTAHGSEMWKTDGTEGGTFMVKDLYTGTAPNATSVSALTRVGSEIFFIAQSKLWKTDGTEAGTVMLDIPGLTVFVTQRMANFKGKLYFIGYDSLNGNEPWVSDGSVAGTKLLKNTSARSDYYYAERRFMFKQTDKFLIFQQLNNTSNYKLTLWRTDGSEAGTVAITPFDAIDESNNDLSTDFAMNNENIYILNSVQKTIVKSNYEPNGFQSLPVTNNKLESTYNFKGTLWLSSATGNWSAPNDFEEVYRSDGIQFSKAFDLNPTVFNGNNAGSRPFGFFEVNNELYFFANPGSGVKLYRFKGDYTFNGSANSNWNTGANWNAGITPIATENVTVPAGANISVDANAYAKNLTLNSPLNISAGSLNVAGNLNLGSKIFLNNNSLILKGSTSQITNGNATNYIVTNGTGTVNIENLNAARGTVNLPIGTASNYNPVSIANNGTSDTFSVKVADGIANTTNGAVNATWDISEATAGGSDVSLTLGWNTAQQNALFDPATAKVGHFLNGKWNPENSGLVSNNSITATGIKTFSPFSVMNFGTLGTSDLTKAKAQVYPNPFSESLNINVEENATVYFYDLSGKLVSTSVLMKGRNQLQKQSLNSGVYLYQIKNVKGEVMASGKVVKK